jgi:DNA-binding transcriptional LysR family regulator
MQHINWDNLRYVLMVANKGSIAAAARELEVNRTTVLRRINKFQENLNCRIFDRGDTGYVLTPEAEKMIKAAREVENTLFDMQRQIAGHELKLEGELRVSILPGATRMSPSARPANQKPAW